ncbi:HEXXH motif domain-containing protein [Nonomuraea longispora]|uniref:HEXXH motif domain-containing protein n=1 Tax=Nonomuraea longispora TaxID=1848320 RepID=A0A4R4N618_9ACTN|nr:HEXXH motif domain-containing protein [Nonomuraea longispora]TDC04279.1 HEXXH motif domain-containing protein [Nonomuraea longispora]
MSLKHHVIPEEHFLALAAGAGGAEAAHLLARAQYSKHVLLVHGVATAARTAGHPEADPAARAYALLRRAQQRHKEAADAVLRHPAVGAWAWRTYHAVSRSVDGHSPARLAAVAAAAAVRAGMDFSIEVPVEDGGAMLPSLGRALCGGPTALVRRAGGPVEVISAGETVRIPGDPHDDGPGWEALRTLSTMSGGRPVTLCVDDLDPYRMPGARLAAQRLSGEELDVWRAALRGAWELLVDHHWTVAAEVSAVTRVLTPLTDVPGDQISGSSREAFGCVALSTPPDATTLALTFAHEVQHGKLSALLDVVPLLRPSGDNRYYAPWRDDPRPLGGLFQGAYAYVGVSGFWRRQRLLERGEAALAANAEFYRWREAAEGATREIAASGYLTPRGERFVAGMAATLAAWRDEEVSAPAIEKARRDAAAHREEWRRRNGLTPPTPDGVTVPG